MNNFLANTRDALTDPMAEFAPLLLLIGVWMHANYSWIILL